jgi:hypothetical protein
MLAVIFLMSVFWVSNQGGADQLCWCVRGLCINDVM